MIAPETGRERGTENSRRVHGGAGERSTKQDIERDGRSDDQAGHATRAALIDGGGMNNENEKESENRFNENSLGWTQGDSKLRRAVHYDIATKQAQTNQSRGECAE